jgi:uncharacterized protein (TIGR02271 family)
VKKNSPEDHQLLQGQISVTAADEELELGKWTEQTGVAGVVKRVREREEEIDLPLLVERVEVERVPVNQFVETAPPIRELEGATIIPVLEEVLVVEKRLLLKEELHIRTVSETVRQRQSVLLRSEEVEVNHLESPAPDGHQH